MPSRLLSGLWRRAHAFEIASWPLESTFTAKLPWREMISADAARLSTQTRTMGGSNDSDVKALAVIAWKLPSLPDVTMVTPEGKEPARARKLSLSSIA